MGTCLNWFTELFLQPAANGSGKSPAFTLRPVPRATHATPAAPYILVDSYNARKLLTMRRDIRITDKEDTSSSSKKAPTAAEAAAAVQEDQENDATDETAPLPSPGEDMVWMLDFASVSESDSAHPPSPTHFTTASAAGDAALPLEEIVEAAVEMVGDDKIAELDDDDEIPVVAAAEPAIVDDNAATAALVDAVVDLAVVDASVEAALVVNAVAVDAAEAELAAAEVPAVEVEAEVSMEASATEAAPAAASGPSVEATAAEPTAEAASAAPSEQDADRALVAVDSATDLVRVPSKIIVTPATMDRPAIAAIVADDETPVRDVATIPASTHDSTRSLPPTSARSVASPASSVNSPLASLTLPRKDAHPSLLRRLSNTLLRRKSDDVLPRAATPSSSVSAPAVQSPTTLNRKRSSLLAIFEKKDPAQKAAEKEAKIAKKAAKEEAERAEKAAKTARKVEKKQRKAAAAAGAH
ncbi:hypothetical protein BC828DRAFT_222374 [Blastocladiella britannica]|nr:hypothetical protein BC828DRAFT_222374 [Blastocladiella britannica]